MIYQEAREAARKLRQWVTEHPMPGVFDVEGVKKWDAEYEAAKNSLRHNPHTYNCYTCKDQGWLQNADGLKITCPDCYDACNTEENLKRYAGHPQRRWNDTFETFDLKKAPLMAKTVKAAFEFCQRTSVPWLVLAGAYGTGKTHICYAIANQMAKEGVKVRYWTVPLLLDAIRSTYNTQPLLEGAMPPMTVEEMCYDPQVLILDDMGVQKGSDWVTEKLFEIIDKRYQYGMGLVVTTNEPFAKLDARLQSRFKDPSMCYIVVIDTPDFRPQLVAKRERKGGKKQ